jgi:nucleotide-binding universal stress UspA family protein
VITWSKIACAVDFSRASRGAVEHAAELARRFHAELLLVHVWRFPGVEPAAAPLLLTPEEQADVERRLEELARLAEQVAEREVRVQLTTGSPGIEIARTATREGVQLIVVGTHGRKGFERAVLGSIAEDVLREAPCAVLVVRAPVDEGD